MSGEPEGGPGASRRSAPKVLYVVGRGHSGSTLLDRVLSATDGVEGFGELVAGISRRRTLCSCGVAVQECELWASVRERAEELSGLPWDEVVRANQRQARVMRFPASWLASPGGPEVRATRRAVVALYRALLDVGDLRTVVDSSKEITRALFLGRFVPDVVLVHLVRDPVDVLASDLHRIRDGHYRFQRRTIDTRGRVLPFLLFDTVAWLVGNLLVEATAARSAAPVIRVRYEDLCTDPGAELLRLGEATGVDVSGSLEAVAAGDAFGFGHITAGNPMRVGEAVRVRPPGERRRHITAAEERLVRAVTWPLRRRYGYRGGGEEGRCGSPS